MYGINSPKVVLFTQRTNRPTVAQGQMPLPATPRTPSQGCPRPQRELSGRRRDRARVTVSSQVICDDRHFLSLIRKNSAVALSTRPSAPLSRAFLILCLSVELECLWSPLRLNGLPARLLGYCPWFLCLSC